MVSAPTGRVCKKKCTSRSCNNGNSDCLLLHDSTFIECTLRPSSCFCCTRPLCCISSPARHYRALPFAFYFFLSNDVVAAPSFRKSLRRRMWHSSLIRQCSRSTTTKLRVWHCVIDRIKLPSICVKEATRIRQIVFRDERIDAKHRNYVI